MAYGKNMTRSTMKVDQYVGLARILARIRRLPRLTPAEERALALRARSGDSAAKQKLVLHHLPLAVAVARRHQRGAVRLDDLIQEASVGMIRATESFDPESGMRFAAYASWWIRSYVGKYLTEASSSVRPRSRTFALPDISLDVTIGDEDSPSRLECIEDERPTPEEACSDGEGEREVRDTIGRLRGRVGELGWDIIHNRLAPDTPETLEQIGRRWGLSRERIRQIELATRATLRRALQPIREREAA